MSYDQSTVRMSDPQSGVAVLPPPAPRRGHRKALGLGIVAVVLVALVAGILVSSRSGSAPSSLSADSASSRSAKASSDSIASSVTSSDQASDSTESPAAAASDASGPTKVSADNGLTNEVTKTKSAPAGNDGPLTTSAPQAGSGQQTNPNPVPAKPSTTVPAPKPVPATVPKPAVAPPTVKYFSAIRPATCKNPLDEDWVPINWWVEGADSIMITTGEGYDHKDQPAKITQTFRVKCDGTPTSITLTAKNVGGATVRSLNVIVNVKPKF